MGLSAYVVETVYDTGRWNDRGSPILKQERSHFDDLLAAVKCYNSHVLFGGFTIIRLLVLRGNSTQYDTVAVGDSRSPSLLVLDFEIISAALTGRHTSQCTLEVF